MAYSCSLWVLAVILCLTGTNPKASSIPYKTDREEERKKIKQNKIGLFKAREILTDWGNFQEEMMNDREEQVYSGKHEQKQQQYHQHTEAGQLQQLQPASAETDELQSGHPSSATPQRDGL